MKDCVAGEGFRRVAASFMIMTVLFCSFQCTDGVGLIFSDDAAPDIELLKEVDAPVWSVYPITENLPSTNIYFVVRNLSSKGRVWAECPGRDLEVSVVPVCSRYTLSVSSTDDFDVSSIVRVIAEDGGDVDEMSIVIESPRIDPLEDEVAVSAGGAEAAVVVDANLKFFADSYCDWLKVTVSEDKVMINASENTSGEMREAFVYLHDIYEVVTARILVNQMP